MKINVKIFAHVIYGQSFECEELVDYDEESLIDEFDETNIKNVCSIISSYGSFEITDKKGEISGYSIDPEIDIDSGDFWTETRYSFVIRAPEYAIKKILNALEREGHYV